MIYGLDTVAKGTWGGFIQRVFGMLSHDIIERD